MKRLPWFSLRTLLIATTITFGNQVPFKVKNIRGSWVLNKGRPIVS